VKFFPAGIRPLDVGGRIGLERFGSFGAPVEVEFAVDDLEDFRVYAGNLAGRRKTSCSISSVLRCETLRVGSKQIPVFGAGKIPFGIIPTLGKRIASFHRATLGVVGNRVIAFNGHPKKSAVDLIEGYGGDHYQYKDRSDHGDLNGPTGSSR
jgi:hypothetical protein